MVQFKAVDVKEPPLYRLEPFKGIDLSTTPTQISEHNSPDMLNFNIDERGALNKRTGYERVFQTALGTGKINGLFYFKGAFLIAYGTSLYTQTGANQPVQVYTGKADAETSFFVMRDKTDGIEKCYMLDGTNYLVYDGTTVNEVEPYVPQLTVARPPAGGGAPLEDFNLLGSGFKDSFSGDGTSTVYQLSLDNLDSDEVSAVVDGKLKTEGVDFTVDRVAGTVTFTTAPSEGTDNVLIQAYKTYPDKPLMIKKCRFNILFGGNNDTRAFVSGNPDYPNQVWRLGLYDATYAPENGFYKVGNSEAVQGFVKQYDYLVIEKEHQKWVMHYALDANGATFPLRPINDQAGTIAPKSIQMIENNPISLDEKGVYIIEASNIRDERNISHVSERVDPWLLAESNLENAVSIDFDKKYWLALNGNVYLYDYAVREWYIYNNIHVDCFYTTGTTLYFGYNGLLYRFKTVKEQYPYNDDGEPIQAHWYSKLMDFDHPEMLKIVRHLYVTMRPSDHTSLELFLRTDKKGEKSVTNERLDKFNFTLFDFNKFSFVVSDIPQEVAKKVKEKKITHIQFKFENNALDEGLGITSFGIDYAFQRAVK